MSPPKCIHPLAPNLPPADRSLIPCQRLDDKITSPSEENQLYPPPDRYKAEKDSDREKLPSGRRNHLADELYPKGWLAFEHQVLES